jgi:hypothetical protein
MDYQVHFRSLESYIIIDRVQEIEHIEVARDVHRVRKVLAVQREVPELYQG